MKPTAIEYEQRKLKVIKYNIMVKSMSIDKYSTIKPTFAGTYVMVEKHALLNIVFMLCYNNVFK